MVKAVLRGGLIYPLGPLPSEWREGIELRVEEAPSQGANGSESLDVWYSALDTLCAAGNAEDEQRLGDALALAHEQAKAQVRRQMGLPE